VGGPPGGVRGRHWQEPGTVGVGRGCGDEKTPRNKHGGRAGGRGGRRSGHYLVRTISEKTSSFTGLAG
jgi:hypothetical protein